LALPAEHDILLRWCRKIVVPSGSFNKYNQAVVLANLFGLGYLVENPEVYTDGLLAHYRDVISTLKDRKGGNLTYVPLYSEFPEKVPEPTDYLLKRLLGYVIKESRWDVPGRKLSSGLVVPEWLFDLEMFGADPISQRQELQLFLREKFRQLTKLGEKPMKPVSSLRFIPEAQALGELGTWVRRCLTSVSSYPNEVRADLTRALERLPNLEITPEELGFREHRALYAAFLWKEKDWIQLADFCSYPTDVLRTLVQLAGGDVSLADPVKFPVLQRSERRRVLGLLEGMGEGPVVEDQLFKYRGLWLALERSLHSGEYKKLFPAAHRLLRRLQKGELRPRFSAIEQALKGSETEPIFAALDSLPGGVALRRFSHAMTAVDDKTEMLEYLIPRVGKAALKDQMILQKVFQRDATATEALILTKRGSTQVIPRDPGRLEPSVREQVEEALAKTVLDSLKAKFGEDSWRGQSVYVDPDLENFTVPTAMRSASDSLVVLGRGSRVALGERGTLRMFVYWKQRTKCTDLDLSAGTFDQDLKFTGYVSWTNLKEAGLVHSGDIQSAPYGAAEFIDADLAKLRELGHRYLSMMVYRYTGDMFSGMTCSCGWMMRDRPNSDYKTFDIATVQQNLALNGEANYALPVLFDLKARVAIWVDLRVYGEGVHNTVEGSSNNLEQLVRLGVQTPDWKLTLKELAQLHVRARGATLVPSSEQADLVFSVDGRGDFHPGDWPRVLSELL
jgi:hypothetical protein